jgi:hypothetical protein
VFGFQSGMQKFLGFGLTYNWVKRSIFWKFLYWNTNLLCHNFDVIYIKKSVFENIFNTIMDVKWKTKNKIKARMDLSLFCHRKNMELVYDGSQTVKPKASFVLEKNTQLSTNGLRFCVFFIDILVLWSLETPTDLQRFYGKGLAILERLYYHP